MNPIMINFSSPWPELGLTLEDNGRVAYAYLKKAGVIVGDVWLYNRCKTPELPEWSSFENIPFANSEEYVLESARITAPITVQDVLVNWEQENDDPVAYIYLFEILIGVIGINDKPGYARFAKKDSPIAKVMEIVPST